MTQITEIAPDIYRISTFIPEGNLQFNQFLVRDEQPLLYHTGMKGLFPIVRDAVAHVNRSLHAQVDRLQSFRGR